MGLLDLIRTPPVRVPRVLGPLELPRHRSATVTIAALGYRGATTAELDEPVRHLARRLHADVVVVGSELGAVPGVEPARPIVVTHTPAAVPPADVVVVPGGLGWRQVLDDPELRRWLTTASASARGVLAMSTGTLLLASVGRLTGREATGHWLADDDLARLGARPSRRRTSEVEMGRVVTASGALAALPVVDQLADSALWAR